MGILDKIKKRAAAKPDEDQKSSAQAGASVAADQAAGQPDQAKAEQKDKSEAAKTKAKKKQPKKISKGALAKEHGGRASKVLVTPVLTEKANRQEALGQYTFYVAPQATKAEVAEAVRDLYGVKPVAVRIINQKGKAVQFSRRQGRRKDRRKAIVTLRSGEAISVYE